MIIREQYRGCLKEGGSEEALQRAVDQARKSAQRRIREGELLCVCLYRYRQMCFLYYEALEPGMKPEQFLPELTPFLESWPEEDGKTPWAYMYHIFHHALPDEPLKWEAERAGEKTKVGRIAFLYPEKLFSYTYWHKAIVDEGIHAGDKYQCIALHENILFSYYEEPRTNVNLRGDDQSISQALKGWMAVDPESHFDRRKAGGENFLVIEPVFLVDKRTVLD